MVLVLVVCARWVVVCLVGIACGLCLMVFIVAVCGFWCSWMNSVGFFNLVVCGYGRWFVCAWFTIAWLVVLHCDWCFNLVLTWLGCSVCLVWLLRFDAPVLCGWYMFLCFSGFWVVVFCYCVGLFVCWWWACALVWVVLVVLFACGVGFGCWLVLFWVWGCSALRGVCAGWVFLVLWFCVIMCYLVVYGDFVVAVIAGWMICGCCCNFGFIMSLTCGCGWFRLLVGFVNYSGSFGCVHFGWV